MKVFLDLKKLWPRDSEGKDVTLREASEALDMNQRSLTVIRKGTERGNWDTLVKLKRWLESRHDRVISIEELLRVEDDDFSGTPSPTKLSEGIQPEHQKPKTPEADSDEKVVHLFRHSA